MLGHRNVFEIASMYRHLAFVIEPSKGCVDIDHTDLNVSAVYA
jgi:hypothetical protein